MRLTLVLIEFLWSVSHWLCCISRRLSEISQFPACQLPSWR